MGTIYKCIVCTIMKYVYIVEGDFMARQFNKFSRKYAANKISHKKDYFITVIRNYFSFLIQITTSIFFTMIKKRKEIENNNDTYVIHYYTPNYNFISINEFF